MCSMLVYSHFLTLLPFLEMLTSLISALSSLNNSTQEHCTVYSRCSKAWTPAFLARKHANGKHLEQDLSRPTGAGMMSWPDVHPAANASLRVPGLITPRASNTKHHVSTSEQGEDLQEQSQAFMKASTVFHCRGTKAT